MFPQSAPNKISNDTLDLFRQVLVKDLTKFAEELCKERSINIDELKPLIDKVLETSIQEKIDKSYLATDNLQFKKELNRYNSANLREICRINGLKISGSRSDLIDRIAEHLSLKDFNQIEEDQSKSFKNRAPKTVKRIQGNTNLVVVPNHFVSDSD